MPQIRALASRRLAPAALPVLAVDGEGARRALGPAAWPSERFAVVELPDRLGVGPLASLLRKLRGRSVVIWPTPVEAGLTRAARRAEMLRDAGVAAIGIAERTGDMPAGADSIIDDALTAALARAMPQQGCRPARAVLPWTAPIKPERVLAETQATLARHLALHPNLIETMALWSLHAWCVRAPAQPFELSPRLILQGTGARSEHARALRILAWVTPAPLIVARTIATHVLPVLANEQPTLLLDDVAGGMLYRRDMRTLIAAGATRDGVFLSAPTRRNPTGRAPCFSPTAIATTTTLPADACLRAIVLAVPPPAHDAVPLPPPGDPPDDVLTLRAKLQAAATVISRDITNAPEALLHKFPLSAREAWAPLLALADALGRRGHVDIALGPQSAAADEETAAIALLQELHALYGTTEDHIPTARMIDDLAALHGESCARDPTHLARRLARFGLKPVPIRLKDDVVRGYRAGDLAAAFARYLIPFDAVTSNADVAAA